MKPNLNPSLRPNWIKMNASIGGPSHILPLGYLPDGVQFHRGADIFHRPRWPLSPGHIAPHQIDGGMGHAMTYEPLKALYDAASDDLRQNGIDPQSMYLYSLVHGGFVFPGKAQRADFWHMDLERLLRKRAPNGDIPIAINYSLSTDIPTTFVSELPEELPAFTTARNFDHLQVLGEKARRLGHIFEAEAGQIVRYDTMTVHRGGKNMGNKYTYRTFLHLAFSPVGCKMNYC